MKQKEKIVLVQSTFLFVITALVLVGTVAPIVFDFQMGAAFFNSINIPLVFSLLILLAFFTATIKKHRLITLGNSKLKNVKKSRYLYLFKWFLYGVHLPVFHFFLKFSLIESLVCVLCLIIWCLE